MTSLKASSYHFHSFIPRAESAFEPTHGNLYDRNQVRDADDAVSRRPSNNVWGMIDATRCQPDVSTMTGALHTAVPNIVIPHPDTPCGALVMGNTSTIDAPPEGYVLVMIKIEMTSAAYNDTAMTFTMPRGGGHDHAPSPLPGS